GSFGVDPGRTEVSRGGGSPGLPGQLDGLAVRSGHAHGAADLVAGHLAAELVTGEARAVEGHLEGEGQVLAAQADVLEDAAPVAGPHDALGHLEALLHDRVVAHRQAGQRQLPVPVPLDARGHDPQSHGRAAFLVPLVGRPRAHVEQVGQHPRPGPRLGHDLRPQQPHEFGEQPHV
ncbi:MAG: hypothetical protein ACK559_10530, partial [bacterium]